MTQAEMEQLINELAEYQMQPEDDPIFQRMKALAMKIRETEMRMNNAEDFLAI